LDIGLAEATSSVEAIFRDIIRGALIERVDTAIDAATGRRSDKQNPAGPFATAR
jgi:hypothetical protein